MNVGIYIDGLGQSVAQESAIKYAIRLKNECSYHKTGVSHSIKIEKVNYTTNRESNVISIVESNGSEDKVLYKIYEFRYGEILTGDYVKKNIFIKNIMLLSVVLKKFPVLLRRIFFPRSYNRPFQTFYIFSLFFIIAAAIIFTIPATITALTSFSMHKSVIEFIQNYTWIHSVAAFFHVNREILMHISQVLVSAIAVILLIVPHANTIITSLATEFVCAHLYLEFGTQKQDVLGYLDQLCEYISENEKESKIHFHAYSFGSLIAIDYLFAFGKDPSGNVSEKTEALITIGTPFEFINAYYPNYYLNRSTVMEDKICWINVYSIADALASNFRSNAEIGESEYGISKDGLKPANVNYEVVKLNNYSISNFIFLNSIKAHGMYWSSNTDGQSCMNSVYGEMKKRKLILT